MNVWARKPRLAVDPEDATQGLKDSESTSSPAEALAAAASSRFSSLLPPSRLPRADPPLGAVETAAFTERSWQEESADEVLVGTVAASTPGRCSERHESSTPPTAPIPEASEGEEFTQPMQTVEGKQQQQEQQQAEEETEEEEHHQEEEQEQQEEEHDDEEEELDDEEEEEEEIISIDEAWERGLIRADEYQAHSLAGRCYGRIHAITGKFQVRTTRRDWQGGKAGSDPGIWTCCATEHVSRAPAPAVSLSL